MMKSGGHWAPSNKASPPFSPLSSNKYFGKSTILMLIKEHCCHISNNTEERLQPNIVEIKEA